MMRDDDFHRFVRPGGGGESCVTAELRKIGPPRLRLGYQSIGNGVRKDSKFERSIYSLECVEETGIYSIGMLVWERRIIHGRGVRLR